ncbi:MAG: ArgE/DapE family deacylase [Thermodesulfobacteriota bacterium]
MNSKLRKEQETCMLSGKEKRVLRLIEDNSQEIVELLRKLIGFKTVAPSLGERVEHDEYVRHQAFVSEVLRDFGLGVDIWEIDPSTLQDHPGAGVIRDRDCSNMPVLVGRLESEGSGRSLILNGHYDVVPVGELQNWCKDPFKAEVSDNKVFGRGSSDMKAGIAAMIEAIGFIRRAGLKINGDITLEIVPEEEVTEMGTLACCQRGYTADAAIIPEPTSMKVLVAMRGSMHGKITVFGRSGHAAVRQAHWTEGGAVNAISKAAKIITALEELTSEWKDRPDKRHKLLDPDIVVATEIKGGDYWEKYPEKVEIGFSANFLGTSNNAEEIEEKIISVANTDPWMRQNPPSLGFSWVYGAEIDESEPMVQITLNVLQDLGFESDVIGWGTLSDAIHLVNYSGIPTISVGPDDKTIHGANEFCEVDQLVATTKVLALSILRWCQGP